MNIAVHSTENWEPMLDGLEHEVLPSLNIFHRQFLLFCCMRRLLRWVDATFAISKKRMILFRSHQAIFVESQFLGDVGALVVVEFARYHSPCQHCHWCCECPYLHQLSSMTNPYWRRHSFLSAVAFSAYSPDGPNSSRNPPPSPIRRLVD